MNREIWYKLSSSQLIAGKFITFDLENYVEMLLKLDISFKLRNDQSSPSSAAI